MKGWFSCLIALAAMALAGCSLSPEINHQALDYFEANDLAANQIILLNILRAKDGAPLHFSELSQIRGQLTVGASASTTFPFGPLAHSTTLPRKLATLGITVSSAPSFDISSLDTKDFTDGVMSPITPQTAAFFLDEGIDYRLVLLLLVSGIQPAATAQTPYPEMLLNVPDSSRTVCYKSKPATGTASDDYRIVSNDYGGMNDSTPATQNAINPNCPSPYDGFSEPEYYAFLRQADNISRVFPVTVKQSPRPVGLPFKLDMSKDLRSITMIDPAKYSLAHLKNGEFQLMAAPKGSSIILCEENSNGPAQVVSVFGSGDNATARVPSDSCDPGKNADLDDDAGAAAETSSETASEITIGRSAHTFILKLRSTFEVIEYVGQLLAFQENQTALHPDRPERCITVEPRPADPNDTTCDKGTLFHLENTSGIVDLSKVSVDYDGTQWSLPDPQPCDDPEKRCDHTLETMSIISLLLNQNKSAKEIATTPAVQAVP